MLKRNPDCSEDSVSSSLSLASIILRYASSEITSVVQVFPDALMVSEILSRTSLSYRMIRMGSTSVWLSMVIPPRQLLLLYRGICCKRNAETLAPSGRSTAISAFGRRRIRRLRRHNRRACSALKGIGGWASNKRSAKSKTIALLADAKCYTFALLATIENGKTFPSLTNFRWQLIKWAKLCYCT